MSNRIEYEFPSLDWQITPPPIGPDGLQTYSLRARRARNEVMHQALRTGAGWTSAGTHRLASSMGRLAGRIGAFVRCAGYGAAKRAPQRAGSAGGCD